MLCDKCKQKQADVFYRQEINGEVHEYHLCEDCAAQSELLSNNMSFDNLFEGFLNGMGQGGMLYGDGHLPHKGTDVCGSCGATFADFTNSGRLGCPDCYDTFRNRLRGALKSIQGGATKHTGKGSAEARRLKAQTAPKELTEEERLKTELDTAIKNEEYEKAAELRDKIRALKNGKKDGE
jgi:protein arginine kinase activator